MEIFKNRPLALAACSMAFFAILSAKLSFYPKLLLWLFLFLACLSLILTGVLRKKWGKRLSKAILCFLFSGVAVLQSWFWFDLSEIRFGLRDGATVTVEGYVNERVEESPDGTNLSITAQEINGRRVRAKLLLMCNEESILQAGDRFRLEGTVGEKKNVRFDDGYRGAILHGFDMPCTVYEQKAQTPWLWLRDLRQRASLRLSTAIGGEEGALASALFMGERSELSGDTSLNFRRSGISHLLALSGLHVSVLIGFFELLLKKCRVPKRIRAIIIPIPALFFLFFTGAAPSTARAVWMLCVLYLSFLLREDYDSFTALGSALMGILILSPNAVLDLSLWLSFAAAAAIVIFVPISQNWFGEASLLSRFPRFIKRFLRALTTALLVGTVANAVMLPLSAYYFGYTSIFSIVATLVLSPFLAPALILSALSLLFPLVRPITFLTRILLQCILGIASWFSDQKAAMVLLDGPLTTVLLAIFTLLLILFAVLEWKNKGWLWLIPSLSVLILFVTYTDVPPAENGTSVHYIRSYESEAIVLAEGHTAVAIDASSGGSYMAYCISEAVTEARCTELQELVLTHYHSTASTLIASLSQQVKLRVLRLPEPNCEKERAISARLAQEAELHGVSVVYGGGVTALDSTEILHWERTAHEERIEVPAMIALQIHKKDVLYLAQGAWHSDFAPLANNLAIDAELLILGAHGSGEPPETSFYTRLHGTEYVIFGSEENYAICPAEQTPKSYSVAPVSKKIFLK